MTRETAMPTTTRPLWYLLPTIRPVLADKKAPADAIAWCQEGDTEWTRMPVTPTPERLAANLER